MAIMFRGGPSDGQTAPEPGDPSGTDDQSQQGGDPWQAVIDAARTAAQTDGTVSEQEKLIVEQITSLVQKLKAGREKEQQAALGGGPATQYLARATGGGG